MVGKKRKSRSWVGVDFQDEADDLRLDRRCLAIQAAGKDCSIDVCYEAKPTTELTQVKLDVDVDVDVDSDYREYLDSLDFEALDHGYCRNESDKVRFDVNDLDSDYDKFIALESIVDGKDDKSRSMNAGDTGADRAVEDMLVNDEENNIRVDNKDASIDADYMKFFYLDDSVNASVKNDHSSDELVKKACNDVSSSYEIVDHSYEIFLNSMKKEGRNMIFTPETGAKVVYDEDESSDSEVIVMDSDPFANEKHTPFVTNLEDEGSKWLESSCKNEHSWFRERVTEILRQPFDPREYDKLFGEAYYRKPAIVEKDMRNGRTRHIIGQGISHSYLDQYIDLGRKITTAGSKPKVLNLLRGFFFWLQNVAHDGVFKPWLDSSCLEVLPCGRLVSN